MASFAPLLAGLEAQCRVLRYDQRGQGRSLQAEGGEQAEQQDYTMSQQADDLEELGREAREDDAQDSGRNDADQDGLVALLFR